MDERSEVLRMSNEQSREMQILARIDELYRMLETAIYDPQLERAVRERIKVLREALTTP